MEIREMTMSQVEDAMSEIETRKSEIAELLKDENADLEALNTEVDEINEREAELDSRKAAIIEESEKREALLKEVELKGKVVTEMNTNTVVDAKKTNDEIRSSKEYVEAFARYIVSENDKECRALLTENVSGAIPVPTIVDEIVRHAWEQSRILSLVPQISQAANYKAIFEISGTDAVMHTEGSGDITEETLLIGVSELKPVSFKKFIRISDEGVDLNEGFVRYIYEEIAYRITKAMENGLLYIIENLPTTSSSTAPGAKVLNDDAALDTVINAIGQLSDEAEDITCVMNKATWSYLKGLAVAANYPVDVFDERRVVWANYLPSFADASANDVYMIVGDFGRGALANFPNGNGITMKYDDMTEATADIVKIIGRCFAAIGVVAPYAFVNVTKE